MAQGFGRLGMALLCSSLAAAFDAALVAVPRRAAASLLLRRRLLASSREGRVTAAAEVMSLRGGSLRPCVVGTAPWGQTLGSGKGRKSRSAARVLLSLRASDALHGGGQTDAEGVVPDASTDGHDQRSARREQLAQKRAARLAAIASGESGLGKVRQHVNPLSPAFKDPIPSPDFSQAYADGGLPLHLDLGCGKGRMLLEMAKLHPQRNFLGVEIREPLVVRADRWVREEGLRNLHYVSGSINVSVQSLLAAYPGSLDLVSVLMPDPWFKTRHKKRRLLQPELVKQLAAYMKPGARFFVMSDVQEAAEDMVRVLDESSAFSSWDGIWVDNPLPVATEREASCMSRGERIYRAVFERV